MDGNTIYRGLLDRGYAPVQAAAIAGNVVQESGGNPDALNGKEGAHGLLQWRLDRWQGLQDYAKAHGAAPNDPNAQLDFIQQEMNGPEKRSAAPFFAAQDVASANSALKNYIRYGDNSEATRLANAKGFLGQSAPAPAVAPMAMAGPPAAADAASAAPAASQQPASDAQQKAPNTVWGGSSAPVITPDQIAALAAVPQGPAIQQRPLILGRQLAPFSLRG